MALDKSIPNRNFKTDAAEKAGQKQGNTEEMEYWLLLCVEFLLFTVN